MAAIYDLAPDILQHITYLLECEDIGSLWLVGSRKLNYKLGEGGGVIHFSFGTERGVWPALVSKFTKLQFFDLLNTSQVTTHQVKSVDLTQLPRTLKSLKLWFQNDADYLEEAYKQHPDCFPELEVLHITCLKPKSTYEYLFTHLPPTIRELNVSVSAWEASLNFSPMFLLNSLTSLSGTFLDVNGLYETNITFPTSLTELNLQFTRADRTLDHDWVSMLPPSLTICSIDGVSQSKNADWNKLPVSLQSLALRCEHVDLRLMPRNLTVLKLMKQITPPLEHIAHLPQTLTSLSGFLPLKITAELARVLPRNLTYLSPPAVDVHALQYLPKNLKFLQIINSGALRFEEVENENWAALRELTVEELSMRVLLPGMVKYLPQTLRTLDLEFGPIETSNDDVWPPNMERLVVMQGLHFTSELEWKLLPQSLTDLDVMPVTRYSSLKCTMPESSTWLPKRLVNLSIGILDVLDSAWYSGLPSTLQSITLSLHSIAEDFTSRLKLPQLASLQLHISSVESVGIGFLFTGLPPALQQLTVWVPKRFQSCIENKHLVALPSKLNTLNLPESASITKWIRPYLPKSLKRLLVGHQEPAWFFP